MEPVEHTGVVRHHAKMLRSPVRLALACAGVACFVIGGVAVFIPGLPTTVFLLIGCWCLTRSCPWLERRLLAMPIFRPFLPYMEPGTPIPSRARVVATVMMWAAILASVVMLIMRARLTMLPAVAIPLAGVVGTVAIWRWRRGGAGTSDR